MYDAALDRKARRDIQRQLSSLLPSGPEGGEDHIFAQAITWKGVLQEIDSILADNVCCIDAPWGFDIDSLLRQVWAAAGQSRLRRTACHDPLDALGLAHVIAGNTLFTTAVLLDAPVLAPEFDKGALQKEAQRLAFDKAVYDLTLNQAIDALAEAKQRHDALERYYIDAMDYARLDDIKAEFLNNLP